MNDRSESTVMNVLGYVWNSKEDTIALKNPKNTTIVKDTTKRQMLKKLTSVFDPLGIFAPVILLEKFLLEKLWKEEVKLDEIVYSELLETWHVTENEVQNVAKYSLPRFVAIQGDTYS